MAGHHDTHSVTEKKPVAFTVPLILAAVALLIMVLFLSLCDPTAHGHGDAHHASPGHEMNTGHQHATDKENIDSKGSAQGPEAQPETGHGTAGQH